MNAITVENLSFAYSGTERLILKDVNMHVDEGDFVCLLGQSGCGKSTFLRLLAGLEQPTEGCIRVGDEVIQGPSLKRSVVFQDYGLFPWMSAGENIVLALEQCYPKQSKREHKAKALEAIKAVGLSPDVFDKYPKELSGGMKQRCAIARAFSMNPPVFLMDEPFGALDAVTRARLQDMVLDLWSRQEPRKTVFFVTHDVDEALLLATRICVFGQSPSHIIFEERVPPEKKPDRTNMYESDYVLALRNELVQYINQDVLSHVEG